MGWPLGLPLLVCSLAFGCAIGRDHRSTEPYATAPEPVKKAIDGSYLVMGMTGPQVMLVLGEPMCTREDTYRGKPVTVWLYPPGGKEPCKTAQYRVYFDHDLVVGWESKIVRD